MTPKEMALFTSVFHLPATIAVTSIHPCASELIIGVACQAASMPCPECQQLSERIHGHYQRTVADLPCAGRNVILTLTVRKFVCPTPSCPRKIFTERVRREMKDDLAASTRDITQPALILAVDL